MRSTFILLTLLTLAACQSTEDRTMTESAPSTDMVSEQVAELQPEVRYYVIADT